MSHPSKSGPRSIARMFISRTFLPRHGISARSIPAVADAITPLFCSSSSRAASSSLRKSQSWLQLSQSHPRLKTPRLKSQRLRPRRPFRIPPPPLECQRSLSRGSLPNSEREPRAFEQTWQLMQLIFRPSDLQTHHRTQATTPWTPRFPTR